MAIKMIRQEGDPALRQVAKPVPEVNSHIQKLLTDLAETMYDAGNGIGLAAPQIGILKRCIVVDVGDGSGLIELVNPEVVSAEGEQFGPEGCLSMPGKSGDVMRANHVIIKGWNREGQEITVAGEGLLARCLLHEIDHLDGILFTDRVLPVGGPNKTYGKKR
ncbi:peptide deformylase [Tumebacillus algifaecis]|uniref:Peptide deformylase n=1 Tax=Tumebacillus algifaecis TaxID=1214604 RepID=A0A223D2W2_9BACL|nr:peptide deformylase [Tumebacillus algifaecis]ASS75724.1 peptide deformylase [Tumebacillus algifaecis]